MPEDQLKFDFGVPGYTKDPIVNLVMNQIAERSNRGYAKYGVGLDRSDLSLVEWVQHLQEELMDACNYLERVKQCLIPLVPKEWKDPEVKDCDTCRHEYTDSGTEPCYSCCRTPGPDYPHWESY